MLLSGAPLFAQSSNSNSNSNSSNANSKQLLVTSASVDRLTDTVTFKGSGFGKQKPYVWCELTQMTVLNGTDEELLVSFPASALDGTFLFTVARGNAASERSTFFVTTSRPQILEGKQGPAGPEGAPGPQGVPGPQGAPGPQGDIGPQGPKGDTGAQGPAGPQGLQGNAGPQGSDGPQGPAGTQGPAGPEGPAGPQGPVGPTGPQGAQGPIGFTGATGAQGAPGMSGYERVTLDSGTMQLGIGGAWAGTAVCPSGKRVVGGGHELVSSTSQQLNVTMSAPFENGSAGWRVSVRNSLNTTMTNVQVKAHVVCASVQ